jgi:hypothetical protein
VSQYEERRAAIADLHRLVDSLPSGSKHIIALDDYEVANIKAALNATGYAALVERNPLMVLNNGDWLGQLYQKLPYVQHRPNADWQELAKRANEFCR